MSHVSVHLNFKPGNPHWHIAHRGLTVPINPKFSIFVKRDNRQWGICSFFNDGHVGQLQYENTPQAELSTVLYFFYLLCILFQLYQTYGWHYRCTCLFYKIIHGTAPSNYSLIDAFETKKCFNL